MRSLLATLLLAFGVSLQATPSETSALLKKVADWQLAHPSQHPATDWTQAAFYAGVMAVAEATQDSTYLAAMDQVGDRNEWKLGPRPYHADDHAVGQMYLERFLQDGNAKRLVQTRASFDHIMANPKDHNLCFDPARNPDAGDRWSWCDSLFMAPPAWVRLYSATHDRRYLDFAVTHWWITSDYLYDTEEHLFFRDDTYFTRREANGRKIFWSRGNGWVIAGLARVLQHLPKDHPERKRFETQFQELASALLKCQQPDGLWRASLLDPEHYPLKETSGSAFHTYALAWGVRNGLLPKERFLPAVQQAWTALAACVNAEGKLTHVQPIGADPKRFDPEATEVYGVGAFLLAGSEMLRLEQDLKP